jgi:hypothetical protein
MIHESKKNPLSIDATIAQRTGVGPNSLVSGWQAILRTILERMRPYLQPAKIITFQHIEPHEADRFQKILDTVQFPAKACSVYLPPSVRNQLLYSNRGLEIPADETVPKDDGVIMSSHASSHATIINALLAHPPCTPAIDVYDEGALVAGYVYHSIDDCLAAMSSVIQTHLG